MCKAWEDFIAEGELKNQKEMIAALKANGVSDETIQATLKTMEENAKNKSET